MSKLSIFVALAIFAVLANGQYLRGNTYAGSSCSSVSSLSYVAFEATNQCIGNVPAIVSAGSIFANYTSGAASFNQYAYSDNGCAVYNASGSATIPLACSQTSVSVLGGATITLSNQWSPVTVAGQASAPAGVYWQNGGRASVYRDPCNTASALLYQSYYNPNCIPSTINNGGTTVPVAGKYVCNATGIYLLSYLGSTSCTGTATQVTRYFASGCAGNVLTDCPAVFGTAPASVTGSSTNTTATPSSTTGSATGSATGSVTTGSSGNTQTATTTVTVIIIVIGDPALVDKADLASDVAALLGVPASQVVITIELINKRAESAVQQYRIIITVIIAQTFSGSAPPLSAATIQNQVVAAANTSVSQSAGVNSVQGVTATSKTTTVTNTAAPTSAPTNRPTSTTTTGNAQNSASRPVAFAAVVAVVVFALLF